MNPEVIHTVDDVYGVSRDIPLNYVTRSEVDEKFISSLSRNQHIVVHGSSKQGKTSLRKHCLDNSDYDVVSCLNKWGIAELNSAILKAVGFEVKRATEKTAAGAAKISVSAKVGFKVPFLTNTEGGVGAETSDSSENKEVFEPLTLDPSDANDIILALNSIEYTKFIVLEDFHYLPLESQKDFSFALKALHENSKFVFIIVGVWREENRLIGFNGDLTERVLSVNADLWSKEELTEVIGCGETLLNVNFTEQFKDNLIESCFDSVHIVQEVCRRACRDVGVFETQNSNKIIDPSKPVSELIADTVKEQAGRYNGFLQDFSDGFQETDLKMPKWIIYAILCSSVEDLRRGLRQRTISKVVKSGHPQGTSLNNGNIAQILKSVASLQNKKSIRPIIIDYDVANNKLNIVDKGFLIWFASQNVEDILEDLGLPELVSLTDL